MSADNFLQVTKHEPGVWFEDSPAWVLSEGRMSYPDDQAILLVSRTESPVDAYLKHLDRIGYSVEYGVHYE